MTNRPRPDRTERPAPPVYRYTQQFLRQEIGSVRRATWGPRTVAALFDFLVIAVPLNLAIRLFYWLQQTFVGQSNSDASPAGFVLTIPLWLQILVWIGLFTLYALVSTLRQGSTPGKRLMNLKVVTDDGELPTRRDLLIRYSFLYICNLPLLVYGIAGLVVGADLATNLAIVALVADFGLCLFDPQNKTLHDRLAHTQVVIADLTRI